MRLESVSFRNAIKFRVLYLETISSGKMNSETALKLAKHINLAFVCSREIVASVIVIIGFFIFSMPLGSDALPFLTRIIYFLTSAILTVLGLFFLLFPAQYFVIRGWIKQTVAVFLLVLLGVFYAAACFTITRNLFELSLSFSFVEIALRLTPMMAALFVVGFAISPFTVRRLTHRKRTSSLAKLLPVEKRGQLISITSHDHYIEVTTTAGVEFIRMTLSGAIDLVEPGIGFQIHRSHWASISAIQNINETERFVELSNGKTLPISPKKLPLLLLELSRKGVFSQQTRLFERSSAEMDFLTRILLKNLEAKENLEQLFLKIFQGKELDHKSRIAIAHQIYRFSMTSSVFLLSQIILFTGLAFLGSYGLYQLPWYQPPLFWVFGYLICGFVTVPAHVATWYIDLRFGSKGWFGIFLHTLLEGTLAAFVLFWLSRSVFGSVMADFHVFLLSTYCLHFCHAPMLHVSVKEHQSYASWKTTLNIPSILLEIPYEKRGELISISAENRFVKIITTAGEARIRKKFGDAIAMLDGWPGMKIHRSHWVSTTQIQSRVIKATSNFVELKSGALIPLSADKTGEVDNLLQSTDQYEI